MKNNFNNTVYFEKQKKSLIESFNDSFDRIYVEIGGKTIGDTHTSRVLPNYDPDIKYKIIKNVETDFEFILCINSMSIIRNKKRRDSKKKYTNEFIDMLTKFENDNIKCHVAITRYRENQYVDDFIKRLTSLKHKVYKLYENDDYPQNINKILSQDGLGKNDYIPCDKKIVYVLAPGANSGKFAVCISQIYNDKKNGLKSTYRKFETFLISNLPINHPINLACSMAMCDVRGDDCIDYDYLKKHGEMSSIDSRDDGAYKILKKILPKEENRTCISEFLINNTLSGIIDIEVAERHAKKEIIRRYKDYLKRFNNNKVSQIEFDEAERIYELIQHDLILTKYEMNTLLKNFIDVWGFDCQSNVCIEEMGELIQAICKYKREDFDEKYIDNIIEELADVHNMVTQLEEFFGHDKVEKIREQKVLRTQEYLKEEISKN